MCDALPDASGRAPLKIVCIGNRWRSDDAAGLEVAARLDGTLPARAELSVHEGEPTALIGAWAGCGALWLVDAVSSGAEPGTVHRLDAGEQGLPASLFRASTHHVGLAEAVELARTLGLLPSQTVVYGIEGESFAVGERLAPAVAGAVERVAAAVRREVAECTRSACWTT